MKGIKKYFLIFAALAAALAFVSCTDEDDSTVAVYKGSEDGVSIEITFSDDNTWEAVGSTPVASVTAMKGTYTGDPSKDGTIIITTTHILNDEGTALESLGTSLLSEKITISHGRFYFFDGIFIRQ